MLLHCVEGKYGQSHARTFEAAKHIFMTFLPSQILQHKRPPPFTKILSTFCPEFRDNLLLASLTMEQGMNDCPTSSIKLRLKFEVDEIVEVLSEEDVPRTGALYKPGQGQ
ncbi:hypothetical protein MRB53_040089 [Persea americana]|nr:hypothetical protein MRB53_040089 [Persea americana]